jgi:UDP:flavonoid glycosyltransferase YjiC (YdhE family)
MDTLIKARQAVTVWVVPRAHLAHPWVRLGDSACHPAPLLQARKAPALEKAVSFADILLQQGFADPDAVTVAVKQWLELFECVKPTTVLCDYAPVAQLAAYLANIPAMQLTNGFDAPPVGLPAFDDHVGDRSRIQGIERLSETIRHVGRSFGMDLTLQAFLEWPRKLSDAIPETDPYGERADFSYAGPFTLSSTVLTPRWPRSGGRHAKRAYAYLRGGLGRVGPVLEALRVAGVTTCCVWPDASDAALRNYSDTGIGIDRSPVSLTAVLEQADFVVNYGSGSVVCSTVLAGKAQLMMPMDLDKLMFARRIERQGAGITWTPQMGAVAASVERVLEDESLATAASAIAKRHLPARLIQVRDAAVGALVA